MAFLLLAAVVFFVVGARVVFFLPAAVRFDIFLDVVGSAVRGSLVSDLGVFLREVRDGALASC